jgi:hypothetical protein
MSAPFSSIVVNLMENDVENTRASFEAFKAEYVSVSGLVPEWKSRFPMGPVDALGAALDTGDPGKVMGAIEEVAKVCLDCHMDNMVPVQQKYHWGDFQSIKVFDPLLEQDVDFAFLMTAIDANFTGIVTDLAEALDNARKQHEASSRGSGHREVCAQCHDTGGSIMDASVRASRQMGSVRAPVQHGTVMGPRGSSV